MANTVTELDGGEKGLMGDSRSLQIRLMQVNHLSTTKTVEQYSGDRVVLDPISKDEKPSMIRTARRELLITRWFYGYAFVV